MIKILYLFSSRENWGEHFVFFAQYIFHTPETFSALKLVDLSLDRNDYNSLSYDKCTSQKKLAGSSQGDSSLQRKPLTVFHTRFY